MKINTDDNDPVKRAADAGTQLLRSVQQFNWLLLAVLIGGCWYLYTWQLAQSVLIGGVLANASFFLLRRDINQFMTNLSQAGMNWQAVKKIEKIRFFLKFYGRLALLAVIIYVLITRVPIDIIGLVIGLSTIMFSVITVVLSKGSALFSAQRFKGA
ncbi:MAG: ATP synthase subunit I [Desulfobulbaceae bacterium]|nr:ATP synthase subunit I [Desulfobulbaceae bacterium]